MIDCPTHPITLKLVTLGLLFSIVLCACQSSVTPSQTQTQQIQPTASQTAQKADTLTPTETSIAPKATETPSPCTEVRGSVIDRSVPSNVLEGEIDVKVYLPPCYSKNPDTRYSVLYMLHGQTSLDDQWVSLGLLNSMDGLLLEDRVEPFIIVLPSEIRSNIEAYDSQYGDALVKDVIPFVDQHYQTCADRSCRAVGGLSRGGNWAVHLGFEYPDGFAAVGAHSAPLFYGEITSINYILADMNKVRKLPVFYIDVGNRDEDRADVLLFNSILKKNNIPHSFNEFLGYHDAAYWSAHVPDYLLWYNSQLSAPIENN